MLEDKIREVLQTCSENPPPNEAATCNWVILPLLESVGYLLHEIVPQLPNQAGKYPDYTILPKTEHAWYLEAKEWRRELQNDQDIIKAINYAHAEGRRWVVLSNGREWRLYDDHIKGVKPGERLVASARLEDTDECEEFLTALGKDSVTSGGLERYATMSCLSTVLKRELADSKSQIVKKIYSILKERPGLGALQASDVAAYFKELFKQPVLPAAEGTAVAPVSEPLPPDQRPAQAKDRWNLEELRRLGERIHYSHPEQVTFPDNRAVEVGTWREVAIEIVKYLAERSRLPLPFRISEWCTKWFLNTEPVHKNGNEMKSYDAIQAGGQMFYLDTHRSSLEFVKCLFALCKAAGVPTSEFTIELEKPLANEG